MTALEAAYIAGLVDGEGCLTISKKSGDRFNAHVSITNTNRKMLEWVFDKVKLGIIYSQPGTVKSKVTFRYELRVKEIEAFLKMILPYLICKREQADLLLEYLGCRHTSGHGPKPTDLRIQHELICEEIQALNKRGPNAQTNI
jgi:hypothetical protein